MKTVEEIVAAVEKLDPDQFVQFRQRLDRLEEKKESRAETNHC